MSCCPLYEYWMANCFVLDPKLQCTTMAIDRGVYTVQIAQKNLLTAEQYSGNEDKPNMESKIAHVNLTDSIRAESFTELNILSAKR